MTAIQWQMMPAPKFDAAPKGQSFGDIVPGYDVKSSYKIGETVSAKFVSANPRNNQRTQGTYLTVERKTKLAFQTIADDGNWETRFNWQGGIKDPLDFALVPFSQATITWTIPQGTIAGTYRVCHMGDHKIALKAKIIPFQGCSSTFEVTV